MAFYLQYSNSKEIKILFNQVNFIKNFDKMLNFYQHLSIITSFIFSLNLQKIQLTWEHTYLRGATYKLISFHFNQLYFINFSKIFISKWLLKIEWSMNISNSTSFSRIKNDDYTHINLIICYEVFLLRIQT